MMYYNYGDYGFASPFHFVGPILSVIFWIVILVLVVKLLKRGRHGNWAEGWGQHNAISILRERYAKGEISKEEYEERKKVLEQK